MDGLVKLVEEWCALEREKSCGRYVPWAQDGGVSYRVYRQDGGEKDKWGYDIFSRSALRWNIFSEAPVLEEDRRCLDETSDFVLPVILPRHEKWPSFGVYSAGYGAISPKRTGIRWTVDDIARFADAVKTAGARYAAAHHKLPIPEAPLYEIQMLVFDGDEAIRPCISLCV